MTDPELPERAVDPWAVVEHHARRAAERGDGSMNPVQRLALYASTAPEVIGAVPARPGDLGLARRLQGEDWWRVPLPAARGSVPRWLAWSSSGRTLVERRAATGRRMFLVGAASWVTSMFAFARLLGPRALFPAVVVAIAAAAMTRIAWPAWSPIGSEPGDDRIARAVDDLVDRYEAAVRGVSDPDN
ncbi:MAG TPA: hypothetical protein PLI93_05985 [Gemmatimonadales bacterium]|nr:hypothetical protein [Gemmatimonadota bacterium]MCA9767674.1 hypothetical protein [Gemmatimonadota bacterium]HPF61594.1 hypothetical protein [Gemmatimonadales bacterium]HRX17715.1 hypothetical protein [Gemmatimonadales bacterium]